MKLRALLYALGGFVWAAIPFVAAAALVPCGMGSNPTTTGSLSCDLCYMGQLVQNIINFLIGLSIPASAAAFAWAGLLYMSGRGVPAQIEKAHKIFRSVVIGFVIVLAAWTIVQAIVTTLFDKSIFTGGSWSELRCTAQRAERANQTNRNITDVLGNYIPTPTTGVVVTPGGTMGYGFTCSNDNICESQDGVILNDPIANPGVECDPYEGRCYNSTTGETVAGAPSGGGFTSRGEGGSCPTGYRYTESEDDWWCEDPTNPERWVNTQGDPTATTNTGTGARGLNESRITGTQRWVDQLSSACQSASLNDCNIARAIMAEESRGNCNQISPAGAVDCMQLMPTTACGVDRSISGCGTCTRWEYNTGPQCAQVVQTLRTDNTLNINTGTRELARLNARYNGDLSLIAAAYNGGDRANNPSTTCPGNTFWQCTSNAGYRETRNYVPNVLSTYNALR